MDKCILISHPKNKIKNKKQIKEQTTIDLINFRQNKNILFSKLTPSDGWWCSFPAFVQSLLLQNPEFDYCSHFENTHGTKQYENFKKKRKKRKKTREALSVICNEVETAFVCFMNKMRTGKHKCGKYTNFKKASEVLLARAPRRTIKPFDDSSFLVRL